MNFLNVVLGGFFFSFLFLLKWIEGFKMLCSQIQNHLIQKFLEDPLITLSTIKDDDHIAAYKMQKLVNNTKNLQLMHRQREQYV